MKYFTDSVYEKMMMQKPRYEREKAPTPKIRQPKKEQKIRKLIIVHENAGAKKQEEEK